MENHLYSMPTQPPSASREVKVLKNHGDVRYDPFYWMRDREHSSLIPYLEAENAYTDEIMASCKQEEEKLYQEILGRIKETDMSVPYQMGSYCYYTRTEQGKDYPIFCRYAVSDPQRKEEVILDANVLSQGHAYYQVGGLSVSDDEQILAFGEDTRGDFFQTLRIKHLPDGAFFPEEIENVAAFAWAADNQTLFYATIDEAKRPYRIVRHRLGDDPSQDVVVYEEEDETFRVYVGRTRSKKYLVMGCGSNVADEYRLLRADQPYGNWQLFEGRERHHEFSIDHGPDGFYILTNWKAQDYRLMRCPENRFGRKHWVEIQAHRPGVLLEDMQVFEGFRALEERVDGLTRLQIQRFDASGPEYIAFSEEAYSTGLGGNPDYHTEALRYGYSSFTTPGSVYEYNIHSGVSTLLKRQEVPSGHHPESYQSKRIWATAPDGARVPISLVYKKDRFRGNGENPMLLTGYGSYGITADAGFSPLRLSLLDRGFVVGLAHIRGGMEMGRRWYDQGKLLHKRNTFTDFIACAETLIDQGYTQADRLAAQGGSAGGMLMGVVANERPDLFHAIVMDVPFVDVLTTMLDPSIPLTTNEYDEWGNPEDPQYYHYIKSYSPYDNIKPQDYPHMLVITAINDANVQYWEPTKWVARLRETKTDSHYLLYRIDMESGHAGPSGRYAAIRERAFEYSFLTGLLKMGLPEEQASGT